MDLFIMTKPIFYNHNYVNLFFVLPYKLYNIQNSDIYLQFLLIKELVISHMQCMYVEIVLTPKDHLLYVLYCSRPHSLVFSDTSSS